MLEVCPSLTTARPRLEIHPLGIGGREDPVRLVFAADPGPGVVVGAGRHARPVPAGRQRDRGRARRPRRCRTCRSAARSGSPHPDFAHLAPTAWLTAGAAHHTVMTTAVGIEAFEDFATMAGTELLVIDDTTTLRDLEQRITANAAYYRLARGI